MNRVLTASLIALAAGAAFALWITSAGPPARGPTPEQDALPAPTPSAPGNVAEPLPTTGTLVIRVRVADGTPVPPQARAGYERFGSRRLRPPGADGTYRFTDVPVGPLEVVAETPGRKPVRATRRLIPGVIEECILVLPPPAPGEVVPAAMAEDPGPAEPTGGPADAGGVASPGGAAPAGGAPSPGGAGGTPNARDAADAGRPRGAGGAGAPGAPAGGADGGMDAAAPPGRRR